MSNKTKKQRTIQIIDKIFKAIPAEPVNVKTLSRISGVHPSTIEKYIDLIDFIQNYPMKITVSKVPIGDRISRHIKRVDNILFQH